MDSTTSPFDDMVNVLTDIFTNTNAIVGNLHAIDQKLDQLVKAQVDTADAISKYGSVIASNLETLNEWMEKFHVEQKS